LLKKETNLASKSKKEAENVNRANRVKSFLKDQKSKVYF